MKNKEGLSTIVATVLIILITMAAVTVVWLAVMPLISKQTQSSSSCFDALTQVSLVEGSTCYDSFDKNLVGWWRFDGNANDETGNGNNGIVYGATSNPTGGKIGGAYMFDGVNDVITRASIGTSITKAITIGMWVNKNSVTAENGVLAFDNRIEIIVTANNILRFRFKNSSGSTPQLISDNTLSLGNWSYLAFTYDGSLNQTKLYINGISVSYTGTPISGDLTEINGIELRIGREWNDGGFYFDGSIDEVMIFNRALSQEEVTALYNAPAIAGNVNFIIKRGSEQVDIDKVDLIVKLKDGTTKKVTKAFSGSSNTQTKISVSAFEFAFIAPANINDVASVSIAPHVKGSKNTCDISSSVQTAKCAA